MAGTRERVRAVHPGIATVAIVGHLRVHARGLKRARIDVDPAMRLAPAGRSRAGAAPAAARRHRPGVPMAVHPSLG